MARRDDDDDDRRTSRRDDDRPAKRRDDDGERRSTKSRREEPDDDDDGRDIEHPSSDEDEGGNEYFEYKGRTAEDINQRANQRGGNYDGPIKSQFTVYKPKEGKNRVRIMRPTFRNLERWGKSWGIEVWLHTQIGPDRGAYPCLAKMKKEPCPICDARTDEVDEEQRKKLAVKRRIFAWIIDRNDEDSGPKIWDMGWTIERDVSAVSTDEQGGAILLDDPDNGFDLSFKREGTQLNTQYFGFSPDRSDSPLSDSPKEQKKWEEFTFKNPLPSVIQYYTFEHIKAAYDAEPKRDEKRRAKDEEDEPPRRSGRQRGDDDDEDRRPARKRDDDDDRRPAARTARKDEEEEDDIPEKLKGKEPRKARREDDEEEGGKNERRSRKDVERESSSEKAKASLEKMRDKEREDDDDDDRRPSRARSAETEKPRNGDARSAGRGRTDDDDEDRPRRSRASRDDDDDRRPSRRRDDD
jgi:hypothetical protein